MDRLVEKLVTDQHNQGEETQLEMAERADDTKVISDSCVERIIC